jgi:hypothetical protein
MICPWAPAATNASGEKCVDVISLYSNAYTTQSRHQFTKCRSNNQMYY